MLQQGQEDTETSRLSPRCIYIVLLNTSFFLVLLYLYVVGELICFRDDIGNRCMQGEGDTLFWFGGTMHRRVTS